MQINKIDSQELNNLLGSGEVILLDIFPPEYFKEVHISGAQNACVYEIAFLDNVAKIISDKNKRVVVYDVDESSSMAADDAARKLATDGYANVSILEGGLAGWEKSGLPVEKEEVPFPKVKDGSYEVNSDASSILWMGRNLNKRHYGTLGVKSGNLEVVNGVIKSGVIILDMSKIRNLDLADETWNKVLIGHLSSVDFFEIIKYPEVKMEILEAKTIAGVGLGGFNYHIKAALIIKNVEKEIEFDAMFGPLNFETGINNGVSFQAVINFDRTLWNVLYGSGKLFKKLGMHLVNDIVTVDAMVVLSKR